MSESTYVISSYERYKYSEVTMKRKMLKSDINPNSEKYEGVKYLIERVY